MNTFGKLAVIALLVLLQVALSVQRPNPSGRRNRNNSARRVEGLAGEGRRQRTPCGELDAETGDVRLLDDARCGLDECDNVAEGSTRVFCRRNRNSGRRDRDSDGAADETVAEVSEVNQGDNRYGRRSELQRNGRQRGVRSRNNRGRSGRKEKVQCGIYNPDTNTTTLLEDTNCTLDRCSKVNETTNEVFCKGRRGGRRDSSETIRDDDNENEVDNTDDDIVDAVRVKRSPRGGRRGGRRNGGRRSRQGGNRRRERMQKTPCGTFNPDTNTTTLVENTNCTLERCTKINETTNEVFCKRQRGGRRDSSDISEDDDDDTEVNELGNNDEDDIDVVQPPRVKRSPRGGRRGQGNQRRGSGRRRGGRQRGERRRERVPKAPCGIFSPDTNTTTLVENATCTLDRCTRVNETTNDVFCKGRRGGRRDSSENVTDDDEDNDSDIKVDEDPELAELPDTPSQPFPNPGEMPQNVPSGSNDVLPDLP